MKLNILDLNVDDLVHIYKQIETFDDKKNFARAHPKFLNAFANLNRKEVRGKICFDKNQKYLKHWDFILEWWGPSLNIIDNRRHLVDSGELLETAAKFCSNLEHINIMVQKGYIKKLEENLPKLRTLKSVEIHGYMAWEHNDNNLIKSLQCLTNLRSLHFCWCSLSKNESKLTRIVKNIVII